MFPSFNPGHSQGCRIQGSFAWLPACVIPHMGFRDRTTAGNVWKSGQVLPLGYAASPCDIEAQVKLLKLVIESGSRSVEALDLAALHRND